GRFAAADNGRTVTVADGTGRIVERLPMAYRADGRTFPLRASVEHNGSQLRLTPVGTPAAPADRAQLQKQYVDYNADLARHQYNAGVGALIGAAIGGLIGFIFLGIGAIPGILIGALIGAGIGWISP
ncbi:MAG: hypothetical protein HOQ24_13280, partial [Mycobacteriaceae bacterium]|nr:hypothetical protein [Mycobacteriaceae bacterium]